MWGRSHHSLSVDYVYGIELTDVRRAVTSLSLNTSIRIALQCDGQGKA